MRKVRSKTGKRPRSLSHNSLPDDGRTRDIVSLRDDGLVRWALTEVSSDLVDRLQCVPGSDGEFRTRSEDERLDILTAALVDFGIDRTLPEMIALTVNLRPEEPIGKALAGLRRRLQDRGLDSDFCYAGVEVPEPHHAHLMIVGIHVGTDEWKELISWKQGRNRRLPRSVMQRWCGTPHGWRGYLSTSWNLGVPGARVCHSTGELMRRAKTINRRGASRVAAKFERFRHGAPAFKGTFCGIQIDQIPFPLPLVEA